VVNREPKLRRKRKTLSGLERLLEIVCLGVMAEGVKAGSGRPMHIRSAGGRELQIVWVCNEFRAVIHAAVNFRMSVINSNWRAVICHCHSTRLSSLNLFDTSGCSLRKRPSTLDFWKVRGRSVLLLFTKVFTKLCVIMTLSYGTDYFPCEVIDVSLSVRSHNSETTQSSFT